MEDDNQDVAVVGVDDTEIAAHGLIQLTTMAQPKVEMAQQAVEGILQMIREPERFRREPIQGMLPPTPIIRQTCGGLMGARRGGGSRQAERRST